MVDQLRNIWREWSMQYRREFYRTYNPEYINNGEYEASVCTKIGGRSQTGFGSFVETNLGIICTHCFSVHQLYYTTSQKAYCYNKSDAKISITTVPSVAHDIEICLCPDCNTSCPGEIIVDYNIADTIATLNKNGFITVASCESHGDETTSQMYILFEDTKILDYIYDLPDSWNIDWIFYKKHGKVLIEGPENGGGIYKKEVLEDIYKFALQISSEDIVSCDTILTTYMGDTLRKCLTEAINGKWKR